MWEWGTRVAQHATATAWTRPAGEPAPTIVDPEVWDESAPVLAREVRGAAEGAARSALRDYGLAG